MRKQQSDLDVSLEDGIEDKEYLSTGKSPLLMLQHHHMKRNSEHTSQVFEVYVLAVHSSSTVSDVLC